jgi:hypothetical protein
MFCVPFNNLTVLTGLAVLMESAPCFRVVTKYHAAGGRKMNVERFPGFWVTFDVATILTRNIFSFPYILHLRIFKVLFTWMWTSYEWYISDIRICTPNIRNSFTRSHLSEEENRTRNHSKSCKCKRDLRNNHILTTLWDVLCTFEKHLKKANLRSNEH